MALDRRNLNARGDLLAMSANGASRPLRRIPAIVSFLNPQPALSLAGGNGSSCPISVIERTPSGSV